MCATAASSARTSARTASADGAIKESTLGTVPGAFVAHGSARFAVVNAGGQQVRGRGTTSVARTAEGRYQVIFDADVRNCGYYATIGGPTAAAPPDNGQITRERHSART